MAQKGNEREKIHLGELMAAIAEAASNFFLLVFTPLPP
jgi:hypothetical protein